MVWRDEDPDTDDGSLRECALEDVREVYPHPTRDPGRRERRNPRARDSNVDDDDPRTPEGISDGWDGKPWRAWGGHTPGRHSDRSSEWGTPGVPRYPPHAHRGFRPSVTATAISSTRREIGRMGREIGEDARHDAARTV